MDAPARRESRTAVESEAWMASLWDASFAAMNAAARIVEHEPADWELAAELFRRRARQHNWSDADVANFAQALALCR
jgi:hypothetical protein